MKILNQVAARVWSAVIVISFTGQLSISAQDPVGSYPAPDLKVELFDSEAIEESEKEELADMLTDAACKLDVDRSLLRAKCLAIALRLDPVHKDAFMTNFALKKGEEPESFGGDASLDEIGVSLVERAHALADSGKESSKGLALYLFAVSSDIMNDRADMAYAFNRFQNQSGLGEPQWGKVFGDVEVITDTSDMPATDTVAEREEVMESLPTLPIPQEEEGEPELPKLQSLVKGLLVRDLGSNQYAGKASQMNATARYVGGKGELKVDFNQSVGESMGSALAEVMKFLRVRHEGLPTGYHVEISFEEQYVPKDGPSAAVACALLLEALITDVDWEKDFAVTGDLNADGSVQPVGGIDGKIRGATNRDCKVIAIPQQNTEVIGDIQMVDGSRALCDIQIFSIETFEDAMALASVHDQRETSLREAIDEFAEIQKVLQRQGGLRLLKNRHVVDRLRKVVDLAPSHLSARYLLVKALGQEPTNLTINGSMMSMDRAAAPLIQALRAGKFEPRSSNLDVDQYGRAVSQLSRVRPRLASQVKPVADSLLDYSKLMREFVNNPPSSSNNLRDAITNIRNAGLAVASAYDTLEHSIAYQEAMGF